MCGVGNTLCGVGNTCVWCIFVNLPVKIDNLADRLVECTVIPVSHTVANSCISRHEGRETRRHMNKIEDYLEDFLWNSSWSKSITQSTSVSHRYCFESSVGALSRLHEGYGQAVLSGWGTISTQMCEIKLDQYDIFHSQNKQPQA